MDEELTILKSSLAVKNQSTEEIGKYLELNENNKMTLPKHVGLPNIARQSETTMSLSFENIMTLSSQVTSSLRSEAI